MTGGTTSPSPLPPPARPPSPRIHAFDHGSPCSSSFPSPSPFPPPGRPPSPRIRTANTTPSQTLLHHSTSLVDSPITSMPSTTEQGGQAVGDLGQDLVGGIYVGKKRKKVIPLPFGRGFAFSTCGRVITDHRSSLAPETVEALMCLGDWIKQGSSLEASTSHVVS